MKLNQATDYAFRMVLHMALLPFGTKLTGAELAEAEHIPVRFLLKIMRSLIEAEIMQSYRGVDGGFALAREPQSITLFDIIVAVEGKAYMQECLYDGDNCSRHCQGRCAIQEAFGSIQSNLIRDLKAVDFESLASRERSIHIGPSRNQVVV